MGKVAKGALIGGALIGAAFLTGGASLSFTTSLAGGLGVGLSTTAIGSSLLLAGASQIAMGVASQFGLGPKKPKFGESGFRSRVSVDPERDQWIIVGETAAPAQLIHFETEGASNTTLSMIYVHACHAISGFSSLSINNVATPYSPSVTGAYSGILTVQTADGTQTANPFTSIAGGNWGANHKGQGLAMSHFRWTYDAEKLASGLPQNVQFVVKGIKVYDPRRDTTVGGSGSMRANDETTWAYAAGGSDLGRNPALVELTYRLGWKKNGRLWAGMGEDPANIDYASYIAAANVCDETVNGKPRYRIDGMLSVAATHNDNLSRIHASCAGRSIDQGGLIAFWVGQDDTGTVDLALNDNDIVGDISWEPLPDQRRNTARGSFIDGSQFYAPQPYPEVAPTDLRTADNSVELADDLSFDMVQDIDQARRLANIRLRESRQGAARVVTSLKSLDVRPTDIVSLTHARWAWTAKKFRVERWSLTPDFKIALDLKAVAAADYADLTNASTTTPASLTTAGYIPALGALATLDAVDLSNGTQVLNRSAEYITETTARKWAAETGADITRGTPWGIGLAGDSLVPNGDFSVGSKGWVDVNTSGALDAAVSFPTTTHGPAMLLGHKATEYGVLSDRFMVRSGSLHRYSVYTNHSGSGAQQGLYARIYWYTDNDVLIGFDDVIDGNVAVVTGSDAVYTFPVISPANANYARCAFFNGTQTALSFTIYDVGVYSYANATPRILLPAGPISVKADYTGTVIAGQLPINFQARLVAGDYELTDEVAWTRSDFNCTAPISSGGVIELTAVNGNGYIEAIATLGSYQVRDRIAVVKTIAAPPPPSAEGGAGATSGQDTNFSAISSSSYSGSADAGPVVVRTNSAGKLRFTCQFSYQRAESTTGSAALAVTPCYRINGAGGFSTSSEVVGSNSTVTLTVIPTEPDYIERVEGYLSYDFVLTGLSANTDYQCWNFHRIGAGSGTLTPIGSFTVQAVS